MHEGILKAAEAQAVKGELACADAHDIAARLGVSAAEVSKAINGASTLRFSRCQLGLFGYGSKAEGKSKIVLKAAYVPEEIAAALRARALNGRIPCKDAWQIAADFKYPRLGIANIIESMGLRVAPCQLGCF